MREFKTIEVDRWVPSDKKGMLKHAGMLSPQEVFDALEKHLKENNLMPDEYFNPNSWDWKGVKELPDYVQASCTVNWGGNEGIYLDISLLYRDENRNLQRFNFATGKTLSESGDAFLHMSRISAECSMMLNGRGAIVKVSDRGLEPEKDPTEKLMDAVAEYGLEYSWTDSEIIDTLVGMGVTEDDFIRAGKRDFVKDYFELEEKDAFLPQNPNKPLDEVIQEAQNKQKYALTEVAQYLGNVQGEQVVQFKNKYGTLPSEILSDSALLSRVAAEKQRLYAEYPNIFKGDNDPTETALHNVCLAIQEARSAERHADLRKKRLDRNKGEER